MDPSAAFLELKATIEKNWISKSLSEFYQQLTHAEAEGRITAEEHAVLWELYLDKFRSSN